MLGWLSILSIFLWIGVTQAQDYTSNRIHTYHFEEGSETSSADSTGANTLTVHSAARWVIGRIGTYGIDTEINEPITLASAIVQNRTNVTVSGWYRPTAFAADQHLVFEATNSGGDFTRFGLVILTGGTVRCGGRSSAQDPTGNFRGEATSATLTANVWTHIACVWNGTSGSIQIYFNGSAESTSPVGSGTIAAFANTAPEAASRLNSTSGGSDYFLGSQDDVLLWDRALSSADISALYSSYSALDFSANLVGAYEFETGSGTAVIDGSPINNPGTGTGSDIWNVGKVGTFSYQNNTSTDFVQLADNAALSPGTGDFTISAWVYPTTVNGAEHVIYSDYSNSRDSVISLAVSSADKFRCLFRDTTGAQSLTMISTLTPSVNTWYHVVCTKTGTSGTIHIDTILDGTDSNPSLGSITLHDGDTPYIGTLIGGSSLWLGRIDDLRLYRRALSSTERGVLYALGVPPTSNRRVIVTEEFVGPFSTWKNVKTDYGATGDGVADDTAEIQAGLDALGSGDAFTLYFPAGTYKVSSTLTLADRLYVRVIGEDPATTTLQWAGAADGTLLHINGTAYSKFNRLTFDGVGDAGVLVDQSWNGNGLCSGYSGDHGYFDTGNDYSDNIFKDAAIGIRGGHNGCGFAETTVERSDFLRLSTNGILLRNFNALDLWVWYSYFEDCGIGIGNDPGAGNFRVYNSFFRGSTSSDISNSNTGIFSARFNTSLGSNRFLNLGGSQHPNIFVAQGNIILDPIEDVAITSFNQGPLYLVDNTIRSLIGATAPIVSQTSFTSTNDLIAIGNTFTEASPLTGDHRLLEIDTSIVSEASLSGLGEPELPTVPVLVGDAPGRPLYTAANAGDIQTDITAACTDDNGSRPIAHIPAGAYTISTTITIPANCDVQVVGDGYGRTILSWDGAAGSPLLRINGPSKATLRDFQINANGSKGIVGENLNQAGGHIYLANLEMHEGATHNFLAQGINDTLIEMRNIATLAPSGTTVAIKADNARVHIYSGSSALQSLNYAVANNGSLLVRDMWFETPSATERFINLNGQSGTLTVESSNLAFTETNGATPITLLTDFSGKATFMGLRQDDRIVAAGDGSAAKILALGVHFDDPDDEVADPFQNNASPTADMRLLSSKERSAADEGLEQGSHQLTNIGTADSTWIKDMLAQSRNATHPILATTPAGVTDLRMYHVWVTDATIGVHLQGSPSLGSGRIIVTQK